MPIRKLSMLVVNQIAAGEVIERPASVVKELVENALDAGARRIDVQVEDGGRELIRIADDGCGIDAAELELAVEPHATSKVAEADDLEAITTLGFRGEALASIGSVSRMKLASRTAGAEAGASLEVTGDQRAAPQPVGCAPGTIIEVRNLFFNTPARRKFMRSASTEMGHISDTLARIAMANPQIGFRLTHNTRVTLDLPPGQTMRSRTLAILGEEMNQAMLEFEADERGLAIWGLAGIPSIAKATARHQYVYVNGRHVRDRNIMHAMKEAYRGLMEPGKQPMIVLFIEMDPRLVDVNVHPTKSEVRFADANAIHGQVLSIIRQRLLGTDLTPVITVKQDFAHKPAHGFSLESLATEQARLPLHDDHSAPAESPPDESEPMTRFVDYFRRMDPRQKGFVYQQVKEEMGEWEQASAQQADAQDAPIAPLPTPSRKPILQVHDSYIVTQDGDGLVIIDQHALHERVMFETLWQRIQSHGQLESQRLLTPAIVNLTAGQIAILDSLNALLARIGIDAQPMGPASLAVHAFPSLLFDRGVDPVAFIEDLVAEAERGEMRVADEAALHKVIDMMSCKAAVKAGDCLADEELTELLGKREAVERSSSCPHGRPTTIRLTMRDLEKYFKRT